MAASSRGRVAYNAGHDLHHHLFGRGPGVDDIAYNNIDVDDGLQRVAIEKGRRSAMRDLPG